MKTTITIVLMITISSTTFSQQTKKTNTIINSEKKYDEAVKTQKYLIEKESNALGKESLVKLNDTTLSDSEREIYINNYRASLRNGNPNIKKKSYDLTPEENNKEVLDLSKSPKLNKKAKKTCANMYKKMTTPYDQFADEHFYDLRLLTDSTYTANDNKVNKLIQSYIAFKVNYQDYSPIPLDKKKSWLMEISNNQQFSKLIREKSLILYNETN